MQPRAPSTVGTRGGSEWKVGAAACMSASSSGMSAGTAWLAERRCTSKATAAKLLALRPAPVSLYRPPSLQALPTPFLPPPNPGDSQSSDSSSYSDVYYRWRSSASEAAGLMRSGWLPQSAQGLLRFCYEYAAVSAAPGDSFEIYTKISPEAVSWCVAAPQLWRVRGAAAMFWGLTRRAASGFKLARQASPQAS